MTAEHPHFGFTRLGHAVHRRAVDHLPVHNAYARFNKRVAIAVTSAVGSMTCAWLFCVLALVSLPAVLTQAFSLHVFPSWLVGVGLIALVAWIAQTFFQLVLLSVIIVGQNIQAEASDARAARTFEDSEVIVDRLDLDTKGGLAAVMDEVKAGREDVRMMITTLSALLRAAPGTLPKAEAAPSSSPAGGPGTSGRKL